MALFGSRRDHVENTKRVVGGQNEELRRMPADRIDDLVREIASLRETMWAIHRLETARAIRHKDAIMAAIDDLKTEVSNLIGEATADITALATAIANQANQDPAIVALTDQVKTATKTLHDQFTGATGTPVTPPATPPTATDPATGQPLPPGA